MASQKAGKRGSKGSSSTRSKTSGKSAQNKKNTRKQNNRKQTTKRQSATTRGRSSGAASSRQRMSKEEVIRKSGMYDEVKMIISLAIGLILLISTLNFGGKVGGMISGFVFGIFGWLAYLLPFVIFFGTAFMISNRKSRILRKKVIAFVLFMIFLLALLQMIASPFDASTKLADYYHNCSIYRNGGGVIGGAICYILIPLFGKVGSYIIILIGLAICFIFISQRAVFTILLKNLREWIDEYREYRVEKKRIKEELLIEEELEREDEDADEEYYDEDFDDDDFIEERYVMPARKKDKKAKSKEDKGKAADKKSGSPRASVEETPADPRKSFESLRYRKESMSEDAESTPVTEEKVEAFADIKEDNHADLFIEPAKPQFTVTRMEPIVFEEVEEPKDVTVATEPEDAGTVDADYSAYDDVDFTADYQRMTTEAKADTKSADASKPAKESTVAAETTPKRATASETEAVTDEEIAPPVKEYVFPPYELLKRGDNKGSGVTDDYLKETAQKLQDTLDSFGVKVQVTNVSCGPSVTRYELSPEQGVKVSRIVALSDDIKLNLAVADIRIEAPIPGKSAVGIEVPNKDNMMVYFRDLLESKDFQKSSSNVSFAVGRDIGGQVIVTDIAKMPHLLIAGATGSGKSVCINTLIMSIIYKSKPEDVRLIMIDPKVVELSVYNGIPHLMIPVVTDPKKAAGALNWAVMEMTARYNKFAELGVRNIKGYNDKIESCEYESETYKKMPQIVIIVDELADLMMVASSEVEDAICRLAQLARAAGIHLVIATQRPSVNVITGVIKANIPSRIAFAVSSGVDSRTILDMNGAEKLLGKGDMLFYPAGMQKPIRVQGAFISDNEINEVVEFLTEQNPAADYNSEVADQISNAKGGSSGKAADLDQYFADAGRFIIDKDKASIGMLQRVYKIGFNRAARIMDQLCDAGVVGPEEGTKPRKVLMSAEEFEQYVDEYV